MKSDDAPEHLPLEKIDLLLELVEKGIHEITANMDRVNEKLLPSSKLAPLPKIAVEETPERVQPRGWFEEKICRLEHIQSLLGTANGRIVLLRNNVVEKVPVKG